MQRQRTIFEQSSPVQVALCVSVPHIISHESPLHTIGGWGGVSTLICWGEVGWQRSGNKPVEPVAAGCARVAGARVGHAAAHERNVSDERGSKNTTVSQT